MTNPTLDLNGKTAIVTGASRGIGLATATSLVAAGANVMMSSRKADALDEAAATISGGDKVATFAANAGEPDQAAACVAATVERFGAVDILVNNAATNPHMGPVIDVDLSRYDKTFQVNVRGPLVWIQEAWRTWMRKHGGSVVNVVSIGGLRHDGGIGVYNVTKAALVHLTKVLAAELAPGVRVNAIAPGLVKTDFARALWEPAEDLVAATMPLQRLGEPDDIAGAITFLASDLASWMTGEILVVDGGALVSMRR
ncbi:MAG: SDR family oxidoreductase [Actinobacteria bacterium]|nr:SDR family oxidoreductase [Actinomycetota bacterium]